MVEAEPTIQCTMRSGKPVVEVGGTWTIFSVRGIREKAEKALQAAGAGKARRAPSRFWRLSGADPTPKS